MRYRGYLPRKFRKASFSRRKAMAIQPKLKRVLMILPGGTHLRGHNVPKAAINVAFRSLNNCDLLISASFYRFAPALPSLYNCTRAGIAQLVEQLICNQKVP